MINYRTSALTISLGIPNIAARSAPRVSQRIERSDQTGHVCHIGIHNTKEWRQRRSHWTIAQWQVALLPCGSDSATHPLPQKARRNGRPTTSHLLSGRTPAKHHTDRHHRCIAPNNHVVRAEAWLRTERHLCQVTSSSGSDGAPLRSS